MSRRVVFVRAVLAVVVLAGAAVVTATPASSALPPAITPVAVNGGGYVPVTPTRLLDTRHGIGGVTGPVPAGHTVALTVDGHRGVPSTGVEAVSLNVTVVNPAGNGYVTVFGDGSPVPGTSNVNFARGQTVANAVVSAVPLNGTVDLHVSGAATQVIADVSGYYAAGATTTPGSFVPVTPTRLVDTRIGLGAPKGLVQPISAVNPLVVGSGPIPASGVAAVLVNVTVAQSVGAGNVAVSPSDGLAQTTSTVNYARGQIAANLALVSPSLAGRISLWVSGAATQIIVDVFGYVVSGSQYAAGSGATVIPTRLADSRTASHLPQGPIAAGSSVQTTAAGVFHVPVTGVGAVVLNVTVTQAGGPGSITVWADGSPMPSTSSVNYASGTTAANMVITSVGADDKVDVHVAGGATQVIVDVEGYYLATSPAFAAAVPPLPAGSFGSAQIVSVSCPAVGWCVAVGTYIDANNAPQGLIETYQAGEWSQQTAPLLPGNAADGAFLMSVSCPAVGWCVSAGEPWPAIAQTQVMTETLSAGTWTAGAIAYPASVTVPESPTDNPVVTCAGVGACAIGNSFTTQSSPYRTQSSLTTLQSGTWTTTLAPIPSNGTDDLTRIASISCAAGSTCVAVGGYDVGPDHDGGLIDTFASGTWSATAAPLGPKSSEYQLRQVSCATATFCAAVGYYPFTRPDDNGISVVLAAGAWSFVPVPHPATSASSPPTDTGEVVCPSAGTCTTVGAFGPGGNSRSFTSTYEAGTWTSRLLPNPANTAPGQPSGVGPAGLACPAAGQCVAAGSYAAQYYGYVEAQFDTITSSTTSAAEAPVPDDALRTTGSTVRAISCATAQFCVAIGTYWSADRYEDIIPLLYVANAG